MAQTLGKLLRRHRLALGRTATQSWVAHAVGVEAPTVNRWENDHVEAISALHLARLARLYGVDPREYLDLLLKRATPNS
jgi:transcriptional regulator with XRE-family HTH domain